MLTVSFFVAGLLDAERLAFETAVDAGVFNARQAAACKTVVDQQHGTTTQMTAYLTEAIRQLEAAREVLTRHR